MNSGRTSETAGTAVVVSGDLEIREHEGKYYTSITAYELEFAGSKNEQKTEVRAETEIPEDDDLPF